MSGSGFTVKVKINSTNKILKDHGLDQDGRAIRFLRDDADRLMNPYIPMDNGMLRRNKSYPSNHEIKYISPYAKYQYYGKLMLAKNGSSWAKKGEKKVLTSRNLKYHTSGTGPKWNELMMQRNKNTLIKDVENFIKTGG
ncbi:MAG: minor capsid protein [Clostridia bacterium]